MSPSYVVTGATGFLGGRLVEILREKNRSVIALGRNPFKGLELTTLGAQFINASITDEETLRRAIPSSSIIIHCAALSQVWGKYQDFYESNVLGTRIVAKIAREKNALRFVHVSTPSVYVSRHSKFEIRESDPLPKFPINHYAQTKLLAETEIAREVGAGLSAIVLRPQGIFGPKDPSILPRLIRVAKKGFIPVIGNEDVMIDLTHVDNVCEAILCAVNADAKHVGKTYNITNGSPIHQRSTLQEILGKIGFKVREKKIPLATAETIARVLETAYRSFPLKGEPLLTRYSVYTLAFSRTLSIEAARAELHYAPRISMKDGIEGYIEWYNQSAS